MARLSHSSTRTYTDCARRYKLHYVDRLRPKVTHGALTFGSALDAGLTAMLEKRDLAEGMAAFEKSWNFQFINGKPAALPGHPGVVYAEQDFDEDLLLKEDHEKWDAFLAENSYMDDRGIAAALSTLTKKKADVGYPNLSETEKKVMSYANWLSMRRKGHVMLKSYAVNVMPRIKRVVAMQKQVVLDNGTGDSIIGYVDLIAELTDGRIVVFDHKTSAREYSDDSPGLSQQLVIYYHALKAEMKVDGVGFIVLYKRLNKNKEKWCSVCAYEGTGGSHRTCPSPNAEGKRCGGEWEVKVAPECAISVLVNTVSEQAEELVLSSFDEANDAIKKGIFNPNLNSCKNGPIVCPYLRHCWHGDNSELEQLEDKS